MITQLAKMLFLATFFPVSADEEDDPNLEVPFDFITVKKTACTLIHILMLNKRTVWKQA